MSNDIIVRVGSGRAFTGSAQWGYTACVDGDGAVTVWDSIAGHYTPLHALTARQLARVRAEAARQSGRTPDPAAVALGRRGGLAGQGRRSKDAQAAARARWSSRLAWEHRGEWTHTRIFAGPSGWTLDYVSAIQGARSGRRVLVAYGGDWPRDRDLASTWQGMDMSYGAALAQMVASGHVPVARIVRRGVVVR